MTTLPSGTVAIVLLPSTAITAIVELRRRYCFMGLPIQLKGVSSGPHLGKLPAMFIWHRLSLTSARDGATTAPARRALQINSAYLSRPIVEIVIGRYFSVL